MADEDAFQMDLQLWETELQQESKEQTRIKKSRRNKRRLKHRALLYHHWSSLDDTRLQALFARLGPDWRTIAHHFPNETPSGVQKRWDLHFNPNTKRTKWTEEEDQMILAMREKMGGGHWKAIAKHLPGRLPVTIKNRFYGQLKRKGSREVPVETMGSIEEEEDKSQCDETEPFDLLNLEPRASSCPVPTSHLSIEHKLRKAEELQATLITLEALLAKTKRDVLLITQEINVD